MVDKNPNDVILQQRKYRLNISKYFPMTTLKCFWLKILGILCLRNKLDKKTVAKNYVVNKINSACGPGVRLDCSIDFSWP